MTRSPNASRSVSQSPSRRSRGADCATMLMTWRTSPPSPTRSGSTRLGMPITLEPWALAGTAVLRGIGGGIEVPDRRGDDQPPAGPGRPVIVPEAGEGWQGAQPEVDLGGDAPVAEVVDLPAEAPGPSVAGSTRRWSVERGSSPLTTTSADTSSPSASTMPVAHSSRSADGGHVGSRPDRHARARGCGGQGVGEGAGTASGVDGLAGGPADPDRIGQEMGGRPRVARPQSRVAQAPGRQEARAGLHQRSGPRSSRRSTGAGPV